MRLGYLQARTLVWVGLTLLLTISVGGTASYYILEDKFTEFETRTIHARLDSAALLLNEQIDLICKFTTDYGLWDDTYEHMAKSDKKYVEATYTYEALENIGVEFILLLTPQNQPQLIAVRSEFDHKAPGEIVFTQKNTTINQLLKTLPPATQIAKPKAAIYFLAGQPFILAMAPITRSDGSGKSRGVVIMGRQLSDERIKLMQKVSGAPFSLKPASSLQSNIKFTDHDFVAILRTSTSPPFVIALQGERPLVSQRNTSQYLLGANLGLIWLASLMLIMFMLSRLVIRRLENHSKQLKNIREIQNSGLRLASNHQDEVDLVAQSVNELLDEIDVQHQRLLHESCHDALTGLGNRNLLAERLGLALSLLKRKVQHSFCLLLLDLDGFKHVNDVYGHSAGDYLLIKLAERIAETIRGTDCAVRLGGDEFAILLMGVNHVHDATETAERLRGLMAEPVNYNGTWLKTSGSIGLLFIEKDLSESTTPDDLMKQADIAMYQAKSSGRDKVTVFNKHMETTLVEYVQLEHDLRDKIEHEMLDMCFQPILSCDGREVESLEVLGRWSHPELGPISPERFISIAENSHLIHQYSLVMIRKACLMVMANFNIMPTMKLSVNISAQEILEDRFFEDLHLVLQSTGFPPHHLNIEITESLLAQNETDLIRPMQQCRDIGINFHIDDFGTGYSSLARLHSLPISILKIDKIFIQRIGHDGDKLVRMMVDMAHHLGMKVISEGVETQAQRDFLQDAGCDFIQGYLYSRPKDTNEISLWLQNHLQEQQSGFVAQIS